MKKYNCIIIEDEPLALERTKMFADKVPYLNVLATFDNALDGLHYLKSHSIDLLFLDIQMDELTGVELLESSPIHCEVIITTAYQQYALKGYELNITDYLLKPFTFHRFLQATNKVQAKLDLKTPISNIVTDFIFIKTENRLEKINICDILYIEGMRDYRRIHTTNRRLMTLQTFKELEQLLPSALVCRVHKSYMVALGQIGSIERSRIKIADKKIPISETYRAHFFQQIGAKN